MVKESLRDRHAAQTRQRIVDVAFALFTADGFDTTTIEQIASKADVSPRTFFRYFPTKEALLFHDFDQRLTTITERIISRPMTETPLDALAAIFCELIDEIHAGSDHNELTFCTMSERSPGRSYQHSTVIVNAEHSIIDALAQRTGLANTDPTLSASLSLAALCLDVALRRWTTTNFEGRFAPHFRATLDAFRSALGDQNANATP